MDRVFFNKEELGQKQEIEVHTKQNSAELFINGTKITDIKGRCQLGAGPLECLFCFLPLAARSA